MNHSYYRVVNPFCGNTLLLSLYKTLLLIYILYNITDAYTESDYPGGGDRVL